MDTQTITMDQVYAEVDRLVEEYRSMCLWFAPDEYLPENDQQRLRALDYVEKYGDREAFKRARELRDWLLPRSKKQL